MQNGVSLFWTVPVCPILSGTHRDFPHIILMFSTICNTTTVTICYKSLRGVTPLGIYLGMGMYLIGECEGVDRIQVEVKVTHFVTSNH